MLEYWSELTHPLKNILMVNCNGHFNDLYLYKIKKFEKICFIYTVYFILSIPLNIQHYISSIHKCKVFIQHFISKN